MSIWPVQVLPSLFYIDFKHQILTPWHIHQFSYQDLWQWSVSQQLYWLEQYDVWRQSNFGIPDKDVIAECNRKLVFVIVFFIIGHDRNRAQDTLGRIRKTGFPEQTKATFSSKMQTGNEFICWTDGRRGKEAQGVLFCPQNGRPCPSISQSEGPSTRPCLSMIANQRQGKPLVSRASAGSMWCTRSVSGLSWWTPSLCLL